MCVMRAWQPSTSTTTRRHRRSLSSSTYSHKRSCNRSSLPHLWQSLCIRFWSEESPPVPSSVIDQLAQHHPRSRLTTPSKQAWIITVVSSMATCKLVHVKMKKDVCVHRNHEQKCLTLMFKLYFV